jgi:hypothetical protein
MDEGDVVEFCNCGTLSPLAERTGLPVEPDKTRVWVLLGDSTEKLRIETADFEREATVERWPHPTGEVRAPLSLEVGRNTLIEGEALKGVESGSEATGPCRRWEGGRDQVRI